MRRPFVPNITINFLLPAGNFSFDPITGNPIESINVFSVQAWMKQESKDLIKEINDVNTGSNPNAINLSGFFVDPKVLPSEVVRSRLEAQAIYQDPMTGTNRVGKFTVKPVIESNRPRVAKRVNKVIGTPFKGELEFH